MAGVAIQQEDQKLRHQTLEEVEPPPIDVDLQVHVVQESPEIFHTHHSMNDAVQLQEVMVHQVG